MNLFESLLGAASIYLAWKVYRAIKDRSQAVDNAKVLERLDEISKDLEKQRRADFPIDKGTGRKPVDWEWRRRQVLERDQYQCVECGAKHLLQVHHVIERSKTEDHSGHNLITLCIYCHAKQPGHGPRLIAWYAGTKASRLGFIKRRGRKFYVCTTCSGEIPKGQISFTEKSRKVDGYWMASDKRICLTCMLRS